MNKNTMLSVLSIWLIFAITSEAAHPSTALEKKHEKETFCKVKKTERQKKIVAGMEELEAAGYQLQDLHTSGSMRIVRRIGDLRLKLGLTPQQLITGVYPETISSDQQPDLAELKELMKTPCAQIVVAASKIDNLVAPKIATVIHDDAAARRNDLTKKLNDRRILARQGKQ